MSRPRNPFGSSHPGRLPATMAKVLAAELSDPSRLRRGKQYAKDGSVLDIVIEPGAVVCEIQGSRPTPYLATIEVTPGDGMPLRRDLTWTCTCPDDDNWDDHACKHVIAALFSLSDELLIEPELLDVWRGRPGADAAGHERDDDAGHARDDDDGAVRPSLRPLRRHLSLVPPPEEDAPAARARPVEDPLRDHLRTPPGTTLPALPPLEQAELPVPRDRELAAVLGDALRHLRVEWD